MPPHLTPSNETERLATLRALDLRQAPPGERFDRLTRLAKRLFNVPTAKVTLVESDTVYTISCAGPLPEPVPRASSFCAHTILNNHIQVVPDARLDPRFRDNPFVTGEPFIRFYAGCPLTMPNGSKLGTLCLVDTVVRELDAEELSLLRDLATTVEDEMAALQMATMDELTRLSNRRGFVMLGQQAIHVCKRLGTPASLLFFDLNRFKHINDQFGHAEGDHAISVFSDVLRTVFRHSDLIGRLGGDEFATLLINSKPGETAIAIERLRSTIAARNAQEGRGYDIGFSVGQVDLDPLLHDKIATMLAQGDAAMYRDKVARKAAAP
ncbi:MAG: sensor domain-containing diguanylate cyclase [Pseudomonadota bacterium]